MSIRATFAKSVLNVIEALRAGKEVQVQRKGGRWTTLHPSKVLSFYGTTIIGGEEPEYNYRIKPIPKLSKDNVDFLNNIEPILQSIVENEDTAVEFASNANCDRWILQTDPCVVNFHSYGKYRIAQSKVTVNGFEVVAPMTAKLDNGQHYFVADASQLCWFYEYVWTDDEYDAAFITRKIAFVKTEDAIAYAKAMAGIDPAKEQ